MTQIMQPDFAEPGLPFHFLPNPIQPDSAASSPRKHKLAATGFQSEKNLPDGRRHFNDTRSGFRIVQAKFSGSQIDAIPSQRLKFGPTGTSQDQHSYGGDCIDRKCLFILKRGKNLINAYIFRIIKKPLPRRFFGMFDFCEWIGSIWHFLE